MNVLVLSKVGGILGPFAFVFGIIMNGIYSIQESIGVPNVALAIILFTLIANILMLPLTIRQQRFTRVSALVQPEIQKIQKKYKGKTDETSARRMQAETNAVYKKYGASPSSGCLPVLISFPILFALYRIIYNIPSYVTSINNLFLQIAEPISQVKGGSVIMDSLISNLNIRVAGFDIANTEKIVDVLNNIKPNQWDAVSKAFAENQNVVDAINATKDTIIKIHSLPGGLNVMDTPFNCIRAGAFVAILIPVLAGVTQYLSVKVTQVKNDKNKKAGEENPMESQMRTMNVFMPLFSVWLCFTLPIGVGLYWVFNAVFRVFGVMIANKFFDHKGITELEVEVPENIVEKKIPVEAKKKRKVAKDESGEFKTLGDIAKKNLSKTDYDNIRASQAEKPFDPNSIASIAHMLDKTGKKD